MLSRLASLSILLLVASPLCAEEIDNRTFGQRFYDYWVDGASLTLGVGTRETGVKVTRLSDGANGKLVHRNEEAYFLSYSTKPSYFRHSDFGYNWMFNLSNFKLNKQQTGSDTFTDLGTRMSGRFAYVVPTLFYNWGDKYKGSYVRTGIGLGFGVTTFDGDIILTDSGIPNDRITLSHKRTDIQFAASFFIEARKNNWGLIISAAGPTLQENGYEIEVSDVSANLGYSYFF